MVGAGKEIYEVIKSFVTGAINFFNSNNDAPSQAQTFASSSNDSGRSRSDGSLQSFNDAHPIRLQVFLDGTELTK